MKSKSHPNCWSSTGEREHHCQKPSGRACISCGSPAGTAWGPYWCPECDAIRLDRISESLESITQEARA